MNRFVRFSVVPLLVAAGHASAALPEGVESKFTTAATDGATMAGLGLLVVIAIAVIKYLRRGV